MENKATLVGLRFFLYFSGRNAAILLLLSSDVRSRQTARQHTAAGSCISGAASPGEARDHRSDDDARGNRLCAGDSPRQTGSGQSRRTGKTAGMTPACFQSLRSLKCQKPDNNLRYRKLCALAQQPLSGNRLRSVRAPPDEHTTHI
jgi:hypothetical protein